MTKNNKKKKKKPFEKQITKNPINKKNGVECEEPDVYDIIHYLHESCVKIEVYKQEFDHFKKLLIELEKKIEEKLLNGENVSTTKYLTVESVKNIAQLITVLFSITIGLINFVNWFCEKIGTQSPIKGILKTVVNVLEFMLEFTSVFISV